MIATVFTMDGCPACYFVKGWFHEKKIKFKEVDVFKSPKTFQKVSKQVGRKVVPITKFGRKIIIGFNKTEMEETFLNSDKQN